MKCRAIALMLLICGCVLAASARADEPGAAGSDELADLVRTQGALIRDLQGELTRVRDEQRRSEDRVAALESRAAAANSGGEVTADYVDDRIQAFESAPWSRLFISGYGDVQYRDSEGDAGTFNARFNPIFHFTMAERLHFNAELEIELESEGGGSAETEVGLEFMTIDYLLTDWLTASAGKFLLPFNAFGPRLHPSWINKLASKPPMYDSGGVIPVLSDVGAMLSGGTTLWSDDSKINYALYLTNGPTFSEEEEDVDLLDVDLGAVPDDRNNKSVGGRLGFLPIPNLEVGASFLTGKSRGDGGRLDLFGVDLAYWRKGLDLRAEYVRANRDFSERTSNTWGYYAQAAYRLQYLVDHDARLPEFLRRFEPVLRWGQNGGADGRERRQLAVGLNYWLYESVPLKLTYEFNSGDVSDDRLFFQLAYGF